MERNIRLIAVFNFFCDFKLYSAVLVIYFAGITGSYVLAMSLFSVVFISSALLEVPTGIYSDRIGRKNTVILGAAAAVLYSILYAVGRNYWFLFAGAVLEGVSRAFYSGNNDALLHDSLKALGKHADYGRYLGRVSAMFQAALTVGAALGAVLANWSFAWVMWLSVTPQLVCYGIALFLTDPSAETPTGGNAFAHVGRAVSLLTKNGNLRLLALNQILGFGIGESAFEFNAAFIATVWPTWAIGISKMVSYIGGGVSYWYSGPLIRKFGGVRVMLFEAVYNRIANVAAVIRPTVVSPLLMSTTSFLYGTTEVAGNALMQEEFTDRERATLSSLTSLGGSVFFGIFSLILGTVADRWSPAGAVLFAQICSLPRAYIILQLSRRGRKTPLAYA
jgi:MFS family permease